MSKLHINFKRNQVIIFVIGLMIITAGYLSYSNNEGYFNSIETGASSEDLEQTASIGDAKLVSANIAEENTINENKIVNSSSTNEATNEESYFVNSRIERNNIYSQSIETYQKILNNANVSEAQKKSAQQEITKLNEQQNGIMIAENLIKTKGIEDLVIFANKDSINVIVKGKEPSRAEIAQIQNIITRELEADIADIHIMNKES